MIKSFTDSKSTRGNFMIGGLLSPGAKSVHTQSMLPCPSNERESHGSTLVIRQTLAQMLKVKGLACTEAKLSPVVISFCTALVCYSLW